mmetsp:Transcript_30156/g.93295  ORF Transcript_30156/g.93295 Transcript_30156/m.93295 type:complete len:508 (-) Transcript_30156:75-1598(-)
MMRRAALLLSAVAATAKKRATKTASVDAFAGLRWRPADEFARLHPDAADAAPKTRLAREVKRSIAACVRPSKHYNETADLVKSMLLTDDKHRLPLLTFNGRIFAPPQYVVPFKNRGLVVMLASARRVRKKPLPNAVFSANMASRGGEVLTGQGEYPETVIAKKTGYGEFCGIMIPNPYPSHEPAHVGDLELWRYAVDEIRAAAKAQPVKKRDAKVFWRGSCANNEWERNRYHAMADQRALLIGDGACAGTYESGNRARLLAASLTVRHPKQFNIKCSNLDPPRNFSCVEDAAYAAQLRQARDDVLENSHTVEDRAWFDATDYTKYKYLLNLPGKTTGSYSRNLNHLWATGGVVLLWDEPIVEWYYPLLETGVTHLVVNRSTAKKVIKRLETNKKEYKRLAAGAARIADYVMSAGGMANYFDHVLEAVRRHLRYDLVLDDRRALLELLERKWSKEASGESGPGACDRLVEFKVTSRTLRMRHPTGPAREVWDVVERRRNICETLRGMK